jgi:hypothetical protein
MYKVSSIERKGGTYDQAVFRQIQIVGGSNAYLALGLSSAELAGMGSVSS